MRKCIEISKAHLLGNAATAKLVLLIPASSPI
jgi:hypothetical protein